MLGTPVKKLIIVSGEKEIAYAELLSSLISLKNDDSENNKIVGIKDGSVEAVVWTEKVYNDNKIQLSSNAKVVFVGKTKATDPFIVSIRFNKRLEGYGVKLGWLGNKAIVYTDPKMLLSYKELYEKFYEEYTKLTEQFDDSVVDTESIKKAKHAESLWDTLGKGTQTVGSFIGGIFNKKKGSSDLAQETEEKTSGDSVEKDIILEKPSQDEKTNFFDFGAKIEAGSLIPDQLFRFAILDFYMNKLSNFLGTDHE